MDYIIAICFALMLLAVIVSVIMKNNIAPEICYGSLAAYIMKCETADDLVKWGAIAFFVLAIVVATGKLFWWATN